MQGSHSALHAVHCPLNNAAARASITSGKSSARWWHLLADNYPDDRPVSQRVTRIVGVETYLLEPQLLAAALQRRFAASAGANALPGAKAGGACEVVVQGDVAAKVWATPCAQSHAKAQLST